MAKEADVADKELHNTTQDVEKAHKEEVQVVPPVQRSGGLLSSSAHGVTSMIGAGMLGLPDALSYLGWIAGPAMITVFYLVSLLTSLFLADLHCANGERYATYRKAVHSILGDKVIKLMTVFQVCSWTLCIFAYTVGAGISGRQVLVVTGHMSPDDNLWPIMLVFGAIECVISQLPSLNDAHWSSAVGAFMSMGYSLVTLGLCAAKAYNHQGTIGGIPDLTPANRAFGIMNSLGAIAFAYSFSAVLMEIEDTIKDPNEDRPPAEALPRTLSRPSARNGWVDLARASRGTEADSMGRPRLSHSSLSLYTPYAVVNIMKRAVLVSLTVSYLLYISVAITGYMAFGNSVNGQVLATPNLGPVWAVVLGNVMVFAHMISAVQVFSQPFFVLCEGKLFKRFPDAFGSRSQLGIRLVFRTSYVALCTFISCLIPFFIQIMGLVGAIVYWPITVLFPILMWLAIYPHKWFHAAGLQTVNVLMALVAIAAATGSVRLIITNASSYTLFKN